MKKAIKIMFKVLIIMILLFLTLMCRGIFATDNTTNNLQSSILVTGTQNLVDAII